MKLARAEFDKEREVTAGEISNALRLAQDAVQAREMAELANLALAKDLGEERLRSDNFERENEALRVQERSLTSTVADWKEKTAAEAEARKAAESQFSLDLAAERQARAHDVRVFDAEIRYWKMQTEAVRGIERELRQQFELDRSSRELEVATTRATTRRAEDALRSGDLAMAQLQGRFKELQERLKTLSQERRRGSSNRPASSARNNKFRRMPD